MIKKFTAIFGVIFMLGFSALHAKTVKYEQNFITVEGTAYGDEGKGAIIATLASWQPNSFCLRYNGGGNAGHTFFTNGKKFVTHLLPTGVFYGVGGIGPNVFIHAPLLKKEIKLARDAGAVLEGKLWVDPLAVLTLSIQRQEDAGTGQAIGTTKAGIGPTAEDWHARRGFRVQHLIGLRNPENAHKRELVRAMVATFVQHYKRLKHDVTEEEIMKELDEASEIITPYIADVRKKSKESNLLLGEGAQGVCLDITYGSYPFTSSGHIVGGVEMAGFAPANIRVGVVKAYMSRVGNGPFLTEDKEIHHMSNNVTCEWGSTTGRPRNAGWLDLVMLARNIELMRSTSFALVKVDALNGFESVKVCIGYQLEDGSTVSDVPLDPDAKVTPIYETFKGWPQWHDGSGKKMHKNLEAFVQAIEKFLSEKGMPLKMSMLSFGPEETQRLAVRNEELAQFAPEGSVLLERD
ncbi:MAG: adenylosuccinate synthetase [Alphaproteobacteria bacterium]|nr:adenylosuccinate synthetase [Alphaproteobacteria bacterium]